jgi:regulator of cell morphogenesis and NO signaling
MKADTKGNTPLTIGNIVAGNYRTAEVFKKYKIDFCCKGNRMLANVCNEKNLDLHQIEQELKLKAGSPESLSEEAYQLMKPDVLVKHIIETHHEYIRENTPILLAYLDKINKVHGANHAELDEIFNLFLDGAEELSAHIQKEEQILFPAITDIGRRSENEETPIGVFNFGSLSNPINKMKGEHETEGERFQKISELSNHFTPPVDACSTYKVAFQKLKEYQDDLFLHIHLENNILFPKALELEKNLHTLPGN